MVIAAGDPAVANKLAGFDTWMDKVVHDWNVPGIGVAIVVKDKVVLARGWGYRDYGKQAAFTARTVVPIASNTKLFTAVATGLLVEEGKLAWDEPIKKFVPSIRFHNDQLDATVTIRDMLAHRTGITRHDTIWYKSDFTRKDLFERLQDLEPKEPLRQLFLYNNMMYAGAGYIDELISGKRWEALVQERILDTLGMSSTDFSIDAMTAQADYGVPWTEQRDSFVLHQIPYYREAAGVAPAGAINSNLEDMSRWLIALMNGGKVGDRQAIPAAVLKETLAPAIALPNTALETRGWGELLNPVYGMGRWTASYRGHLVTYHGGDINGFHSQVAMAPNDGVGVVVLVIGDHCAALYNVVAYQVFERLMGLAPLTPWSQRILDVRLKGKKAGTEAREKAGAERVKDTHPAHALEDYTGEFVHPAYGVLKIEAADKGLIFDFHKIHLPLSHFHYERFDTPDDEEDGKWSVNFNTSPQGEVDRAMMSLDESEAAFTRRPAADLATRETLSLYAGNYETPTGAKIQVVLKEDGSFGVAFPGAPFQVLQPWKPRKFRVPEFSDVVVEFVVENGAVTAMKQIDPSGEYVFPRR
ncbi:MAG: serine hydrolase [Acidobacteria bacterium]|nr:serine hydrolase [Acidobacteriota bacterium]